MKSILRQITLLICSGVIIPLCCQSDVATNRRVPPAHIEVSAKNSISDAAHFSFIHDVAAKAIPFLDFFN